MDIKNFEKKEISLREKAKLLDVITWTNKMEWKHVQTLAKHFDVYELPLGTKILTEGEKNNDFLGLVVFGKARVVKQDIDGRDKAFHVINAGKTFGEMSLIDSFPCSASVIVNTDKLVLMSLTRDNLLKILDKNPRLGNKILLKIAQLMSLRLRSASGQLVDFIDDE